MCKRIKWSAGAFKLEQQQNIASSVSCCCCCCCCDKTKKERCNFSISDWLSKTYCVMLWDLITYCNEIPSRLLTAVYMAHVKQWKLLFSSFSSERDMREGSTKNVHLTGGTKVQRINIASRIYTWINVEWKKGERSKA